MVSQAQRFLETLPPPERVLGNIVSAEWTRHVRQRPDQGASFPIAIPSSLGQAMDVDPQRLLQQADLPMATQEILTEIEAFGMRRGWTFPVVDSINNTFSALLVDCTSDADDQARLMAEQENGIRSAFLFFTEGLAVRSLLLRHDSELLTPRETEALSWVQIGKKSKEIGLCMGIETCTANDHVARAISKLEASNRTQAATRAMIAGL